MYVFGMGWDGDGIGRRRICVVYDGQEIVLYSIYIDVQ